MMTDQDLRHRRAVRLALTIGVVLLALAVLVAIATAQADDTIDVETTAQADEKAISSTTTTSVAPIAPEPTDRGLRPARSSRARITTTTSKKLVGYDGPVPTTTTLPLKLQQTTTTTAAPAPVDEAWRLPEGCSAGGKKDREHARYCWGGLINRFDWPKTKAFDVLYCESTGDANAIGPRDSEGKTPNGLMQVKEGTLDPYGNVAHAHRMWKARGWRPWACA